MRRERRPSPEQGLAHDGEIAEGEAERWRPAPGKVTRTMRLQRRATGAAGGSAGDVLGRLGGSTGSPLPAALAEALAAALGRDVGDVRVHTGTVAADAARDLAAEAFAVGSDIYFAAGAYRPESERGRHLIAHEVAHTAQQQGASNAGEIEVSEPHDASELEADRFADAFAAREPAREPARIVPATTLSMVTPVRRRLIALRPAEDPDPPGTPKAPPSSSPSSPAPPEMKDCKGVKVDVEPIELFPSKVWTKNWDVVPKTFVPIAQGLIMVDIVPVTYGVEGEYSLATWATGSIGPGMLNAAAVYLDCETAEELGIGKKPGEEGAHGASAESDRDKLNRHSAELHGAANMDFTASATAGVAGGAQLKAKVGIADIFKTGGFAGLSVNGVVAANAKFSPRIAMGWKQGTATVTSVQVNAALSGSISISVFADAGIYVELSPPHIPIISDVVNTINQVPVIEWLIPDPGKYTWRSDLWKKSWPVANKTRDWNLTRSVTIGGTSSSADAVSEFTAAPPDFAAMVKELEAEGKSEIPSSDPGPEALAESSSSGAVATAQAAATAQITNARREIDREQKWNAKAKDALAQQKAKSAGTGGGNAHASPSLAGAGGGPEAQLAAHGKALEDAVSGANNLQTAAGRAGQGASGNLPTRAEAKAGLESVAQNADRLGDAVASGQGKFERPSISGDKAAEAAFEARRRTLQLRIDAVADPVLTEASWTDAQLKVCDGCPAIADYRGLLAAHQQRVQTLSARLDMVETGLTDAWTTALGGEFPAANAKLDEVERQLGWVEGQTPTVNAQRPKPTWDDRYAAPEGGTLQLRPEFRGVIRETFYPSGYRKGKSARDQVPVIVKDGVEYWEFNSPNPSIQPEGGKNLWRLDNQRERPTIDHKPPVATHWNSTGHATNQKSRADAYNGAGMSMTVVPQALNSSEGSGGVNYSPQVKITFRGS